MRVEIYGGPMDGTTLHDVSDDAAHITVWEPPTPPDPTGPTVDINIRERTLWIDPDGRAHWPKET